MTNNVNSDLSNSKIALKDGQSFYFVFEKVDQQNYDFWQLYEQQATYLAGYFNGFCKLVEENRDLPYPNEHSKILNYNEYQYNKIKNYIKKKRFFKKGTFSGIKGGTSGMNQILCPSREDKKVFMVYASTVPVSNKHTINHKKYCTSDILDYRKFFGEIIMSFVFMTGEDTPTVTHYGIFRNPLHFLEDMDEKYVGISMKLHGFGANIGLTRFKGKKYMITQPMSSMSNIMTKYLGKGNIFVGTNQDLKSEQSIEATALLKDFPPIYHKSAEGSRIAFPEIDLNQHLDILPDEKAEFKEEKGQRFDYSGSTLSAMTTVIKLDKLAEFYFAENLTEKPL